MDFKFFQKPKPIGNMYIGFNMDDALIAVLRYKQYWNEQIILTDTALQTVGVPISNCWMRIRTWRNYDNMYIERIEIDYTIIEANTTPTNFTLKMNTQEFLRKIQLQNEAI